jgi:hypothetical protein
LLSGQDLSIFFVDKISKFCGYRQQQQDSSFNKIRHQQQHHVVSIISAKVAWFTGVDRHNQITSRRIIWQIASHRFIANIDKSSRSASRDFYELSTLTKKKKIWKIRAIEKRLLAIHRSYQSIRQIAASPRHKNRSTKSKGWCSGRFL